MDVPIGELLRPASVEEALALLADHPGARPLAGGTDLVVQMRDGRRQIDALVDLGALGMCGTGETDGYLEIGAATTMEAIALDPRVAAGFPALAAAAAQVGAWPIQCRATLGGNLANASPAADTAPALLVAEAELLLASAAGRRRVSIDRFFRGPGRTVLAPDELILAVRLPLPRQGDGARTIERFVKVGPRQEQVIAVVSLASRAVLGADGAIAELRLALGSVAPTPVRARHAEAALAGRRPDAAARRAAAAALQLDIAPIDDVRAPARYRRIAAAVLLDRFLREVAGG
ncbi:MAG TPA: FAD binding domain-containing protein [Thermoanaerobaculaceae bacterium]|nr:FAD binding domain-containing protein [Thermoanaerobaculaceae bacterium]